MRRRGSSDVRRRGSSDVRRRGSSRGCSHTSRSQLLQTEFHTKREPQPTSNNQSTHQQGAPTYQQQSVHTRSVHVCIYLVTIQQHSDSSSMLVFSSISSSTMSFYSLYLYLFTTAASAAALCLSIHYVFISSLAQHQQQHYVFIYSLMQHQQQQHYVFIYSLPQHHRFHLSLLLCLAISASSGFPIQALFSCC